MGGSLRSERDREDPGIAWLAFDPPERRNALGVRRWLRIPEAPRALLEQGPLRLRGR